MGTVMYRMPMSFLIDLRLRTPPRNVWKPGVLTALSEARLKNSYYTRVAERTSMHFILQNYLFAVLSTNLPWFSALDCSSHHERDHIMPWIEKHRTELASGWMMGGTEPTSAYFIMRFSLERLSFAMGPTNLPRKRKPGISWLMIDQRKRGFW
ncbi:hypothetical protein FRB91_009687 [Serendipita sp. 411]|nr:hypothetical protein FRB91_009687 [Serendipita sp. 411]